MVDLEKDRLGEKLRKKEKGHEDEYFARRERELIEKLRKERRSDSAAHAQGSMNCPRCGTPLTERVDHDITIDECGRCGGLWLDKGEMEHIAKREQEGWFGQLLRGRLAKK